MATEPPSRLGRESILCLICRSGIAAFFDMVHNGADDASLISGVEVICKVLGILRPESCRGVLELNIPIFTHIIKTTPEAAPRSFCGLVLQRGDDPNYCVIEDPRFDWTVDLPPKNLDLGLNKKVFEDRNAPLTIALITDAHIDPLYEPNGVADCNEPTCCRKGQLPRKHLFETEQYDLRQLNVDNYLFNEKNDTLLDLDIVKEIKDKRVAPRYIKRDTSPAGYWGDYRNCDTPLWAYDDVIERISTSHPNVDVIYYMGDSIDHHVWETTYDMINDVNLYLVNKIRKEFGDNVLVLPTLGNHESQPTNQFAPITVTGEKLNTTWLYDSLAKKWDFFLTEEAKLSVRRLGSFSMLIRPGFRVVSLNNNVAYKYNWWLVYDPLDAKKHLEWLIEELYKAELSGERVHILAHMPPGVHDLTHTWTREYNRVINRFSSTVAAEFNGHTHSDEFKIFYSTDDGSPSNMAWGVGSATAYTNYNLNYKIATVDATTFEPINIVNYIYNLTEANLTPQNRPNWFQLYDTLTTYGLKDLSPNSMDTLVQDMVAGKFSGTFLLQMYTAFIPKLSDTRWYCNNRCKIDKLCNAVTTVLWERERCDQLRKLFSL